MSRRRKHVTLGSLQDDVEPPTENQRIVRALGTRGGNLVEVEHPGGEQTLVVMPAKFNKKLWVKRGGYLIIEDGGEEARAAGGSVTGVITAVLYEQHVKALRKLPGVWPPEFSGELAASGSGRGADDEDRAGQECAGSGDSGGESGSDDGLPPLQPNTNGRPAVEYDVSDSSGDEGG